jgi:predicted nucleic acid-binding Zn ribbon protein
VAHQQLTSPEDSNNEQIENQIHINLFIDTQCAVHKQVVSQGQAFNQQCCREVLERLRKRVHRARPEIADTWMLHHDNAPCHTAISVNEFLTKKGIPVVP